MTNFDFLKSNPEFLAFSDACIEAEKSITTSPALCALGVRKSTELAVKWLYTIDKSMQQPFKDNLSALIYNPSFADSIDDDLMNKLKFIIKLGNYAAHTNKSVTYREAMLALAGLFDFMQFIDYCYGKDYHERVFDESILAPESGASVSRDAFELLKAELDSKGTEREKLLEELKRLRDEMDKLRATNTASRTYSASTHTEAATRKSYIDVDIKAMGWQFGDDCIEEYPVVGMPRDSGDGRADYVLFGDNGRPLAVVEAKRTSVDPKVGQHQAKLYADCLEKMTGQRPLIFYTNGYTTWFWDDTYYPERKVYSVFSKDDLQRIINRRELRVPFDHMSINPAISDRHYQITAIQRVCDELAKSRRKFLLVMATGTGKTRTAISLVDVLMSHAWVTNILFLADRRELVKQAKKAFNKHMPNLSTCNLMDRGKDKPTDRAIFSTYPTIMGAINDERTDDGKKLFSPAYFDLIIVDEAHRSIFKKYRAIFEYFDAALVGLTATPRDDVSHNTYEFFDLEDNMPTYAYEYNTAVAEHFLTDYHCIEKLYKIPTHGIHYDDLSQDDQTRFEDVFEEGEEVPDFVSGEDINRIFLNVNTNQRVLAEVMQKGLRVEGGDKLGKTIIFARNHTHAQFLEDQFNLLFPQYHGEFARVIDDKVAYAEDLLDSFKQNEKYPQIAISVDMLDTGVDVPEIVNLVFFKRVLSKTKFWQMFGRGTRLCGDLFGPGENKQVFYIFDYLGNFEFFRQNPKGKDVDEVESMSERTIKIKVRLIKELQEMKFQQPDLIAFRAQLVSEVTSQVAALNRDQFQVRQQIQYVEKYADPAAFQCLGIIETEDMLSHLSGLIPAVLDDETARRLDVLLFRLMLAYATDDESAKRSIVNRVKGIAEALETKGTIPQVYAQREMLAQIKKVAFWESASIPELETVRCQLRDLIQYLRKEMKTKIINITDAVLLEKEGERFTSDTTYEAYYQRADRYVKENEERPSIRKLKNNEPLTDCDWNELEDIFWYEVGTKADYEQEVGEDMPLGRFVRGITGLSQEAALAAFSEFLDGHCYTEAQIAFVRNIIEYIMRWGTLDLKDMKDDELAGGVDFVEVFANNVVGLKALIERVIAINSNAERKAA